MRQILRGTDEPAWLDPDGRQLLRSARHTAEQLGLTQTDVLKDDDIVQWFPWIGTRGVTTLCLWAESREIACCRGALSLSYEDISLSAFRRHLQEMVDGDVDPVELAALLKAKGRERFDRYVAEDLVDKANAQDRLDLQAANQAARDALAELET